MLVNRGSSSNDSLNGSSDEDYIVGLQGNDILDGLDSDDIILSGFGDDTANGLNGRDLILGDSNAEASFAGNGLRGYVYNTWADIDNLSEALALTNTSIDATFISTSLDYPNGNSNTGGGNLGSFLGDDAVSLSNGSNTSMTTLAFKFEGYIYIPAGTHEFSVSSDDGFQLSIGGEVFSSFTGNRSFGTTTESGTFAEGLYAFELIYWENRGVNGIEVKASFADGALDSQYFFQTLAAAGNPGTFVSTGPGTGYYAMSPAADDTLSGGNGEDSVYGEEGDDLLYGGADHDSLSGGADHDSIFGGSGNDVLAGDNISSSTSFEIISERILPSTSIVGHWRLDEGDGVIAFDESSLGNDGGYKEESRPGGNPATPADNDGSGIFGMPDSWIPGSILNTGGGDDEENEENEENGSAYDAYEGYVEIAHDDAYLLDNGTVQFWINPAIVDGKQTIFSKDSDGRDDGGHLTIYLDDGELKARLQSTNRSYTVDSANDDIQANVWTHVAFSWGDDGMRLYVNGELVDTNSYTGGLGSTSGGTGNDEPITFGATQDDSGNLVANNLDDWFHGQIDEVMLLNDDIEQGIIQQIYKAQLLSRPPVERDGNDLVDGGEGDDTIDGNGGDDSLIGGPGVDHVFGGLGNDWIAFDSKDVTIRGGEGIDTLQVSDLGSVNDYIPLWNTQFHGGDTMIGNGGFEVVNLGGGNDILVGDSRAESSINTSLEVDAGAGNDRISLWGNGDDVVFGGDGSDRIWSSLGDDRLYGGDDAVRDFFYGGAGSDVMFGGKGSDVYYVGWGDGTDSIVDSYGENNGLVFFYGWNTRPVDGTYYGVDADDISFLYDDIAKTVTATISENGRTATAVFDYGAVEYINLWETPDATTIQNPPDVVHIYEWIGDENSGMFVAT